VPPLGRRLASREFVNLGDRVCVTVAGEPLEEVPPAKRSSRAERYDAETSEEKRHRE
jgi:hypothetical protein